MLLGGKADQYGDRECSFMKENSVIKSFTRGEELKVLRKEGGEKFGTGEKQVLTRKAGRRERDRWKTAGVLKISRGGRSDSVHGQKDLAAQGENRHRRNRVSPTKKAAEKRSREEKAIS